MKSLKNMQILKLSNMKKTNQILGKKIEGILIKKNTTKKSIILYTTIEVKKIINLMKREEISLEIKETIDINMILYKGMKK